MLERILVPLDGSVLSERILPRVAHLARAARSEVVLLRVVPGTSVGEDAVEPARARLEQLRERLEAEGVAPPRVRLVTGHAPTRILEVADEVRPTLVALSSHGRSGIERWVRGSTAERVLRNCPFPVLAAGATALDATADPKLRRIVVAVEGAGSPPALLALVGDLARPDGAEVVLVHAVEVRPRPGEETGESPDPDTCRAVLRILEDEARALPGGVASRPLVVWGPEAPAAILDAATRERADLLALATHGSSGRSRWLLGTVAERVLSACRQPLLVVRTGGPG